MVTCRWPRKHSGLAAYPFCILMVVKLYILRRIELYLPLYANIHPRSVRRKSVLKLLKLKVTINHYSWAKILTEKLTNKTSCQTFWFIEFCHFNGKIDLIHAPRI